MSDHIELRGLRVVATHGVLDSEKKAPQPFEIDLDIEADLREAGFTDDLKTTVNYGQVALIVDEVVRQESNELLERVAQRICDAVLAIEHVISVEVTLRKLRPPIPLDVASAAVRIKRP